MDKLSKRANPRLLRVGQGKKKQWPITAGTHATPQKRKDILTHGSPDLVHALCDMALNLLKVTLLSTAVQENQSSEHPQTACGQKKKKKFQTNERC